MSNLLASLVDYSHYCPQFTTTYNKLYGGFHPPTPNKGDSPPYNPLIWTFVRTSLPKSFGGQAPLLFGPACMEAFGLTTGPFRAWRGDSPSYSPFKALRASSALRASKDRCTGLRPARLRLGPFGPLMANSGEATRRRSLPLLRWPGGRGGRSSPLPQGLKSERSEAEVPEGRTTTEA